MQELCARWVGLPAAEARFVRLRAAATSYRWHEAPGTFVPRSQTLSTYRLDQFERGSVTLSSGLWRWYVIRLNSLPEQVCQLQQLIFISEPDGGDLMRARVPSDVDTVDERTVEQYARNPDDRTFRAPTGWITVRPPVESGPGRMWSIWPEKGYIFRKSHAVEKPLGELTREDMLKIAAQ